MEKERRRQKDIFLRQRQQDLLRREVEWRERRVRMSVPVLGSAIHPDREACGKNEAGETRHRSGRAESEELPHTQMKK